VLCALRTRSAPVVRILTNFLTSLLPLLLSRLTHLHFVLPRCHTFVARLTLLLVYHSESDHNAQTNGRPPVSRVRTPSYSAVRTSTICRLNKKTQYVGVRRVGVRNVTVRYLLREGYSVHSLFLITVTQWPTAPRIHSTTKPSRRVMFDQRRFLLILPVNIAD